MITTGAVCEELHKPLEVKEIELGNLEPDEVLVRIHYGALNHRDVYITQGLYAGIKLPCILGSDGAGVVEQTGENVRNCKAGDEVVIQPGFNWGDDPRFQSKNYTILGMPLHGTFATYLKIKSTHIYAKPANLDMKSAASIPLAGLTAYRALFTRGGCKPQHKVLVTGAGGGVALFAIQFAIAAGCEVWCTSGSDDKIEKVKALGAKGGINYKTEKWHKELLSTAGEFDVVIDSAGGGETAKLTDLCTNGGTISMYGGTLGNLTNIIPAKIFWRQINICGSTMGTTEEFERMLKFVEEKNIRPICSHEFSLAEINDAFKLMNEGGQFGKIIVKCD